MSSAASGDFASTVQPANPSSASVENPSSVDGDAGKSKHQTKLSELPRVLSEAQIRVMCEFTDDGAVMYCTPVRSVIKDEYRHLPDHEIAAPHLDYDTLKRLWRSWRIEHDIPKLGHLSYGIAEDRPDGTILVQRLPITDQQIFEYAIDHEFHMTSMQSTDGAVQLLFYCAPSGAPNNIILPPRTENFWRDAHRFGEVLGISDDLLYDVLTDMALMVYGVI